MVNDGAVVVAPDRVAVAFDDERLVADAGIVLAAALAGRLGIEALVDQTLDLGDRVGAANGRCEGDALIAAMALGADSIDDCDLLRSGSTATVLGQRVAAPSTLGTFLRTFSFGHVRQLDRVLAESIARAWRAGAGPAQGRLVVDVHLADERVDAATRSSTSHRWPARTSWPRWWSSERPRRARSRSWGARETRNSSHWREIGSAPSAAIIR